MTARAVLFDVDGTLLDTLGGLRQVWHACADLWELDREELYRRALKTVPLETFHEMAPHLDPSACLATLHELEDNHARHGDYAAFPGAQELLSSLPDEAWAVVTSNYAHRVAIRFERLGLPMPRAVIDAAAVSRGKPDPEGYLLAARRPAVAPEACLVIEDGQSGIDAALAAGMTVWAVNGGATNASAHRRYGGIDEAVDDIRAWLRA